MTAGASKLDPGRQTRRHVEQPEAELSGLGLEPLAHLGLEVGPSIDCISIGMSSRSTNFRTVSLKKSDIVREVEIHSSALPPASLFAATLWA